MRKIKLTKNEYKSQKDALRMFQRYLPTLLLKKRQLQTEIYRVQRRIEEVRESEELVERDMSGWVSVFSEKGEDQARAFLPIERVHTRIESIAGVAIPLFERVDFSVSTHDLYATPLWIDRGIEALKKGVSLAIERKVLEEQVVLLERELRLTTQRVNLFEKVKIPETKENIRRIAVFLGDQQTAAVVRGKISKRKLMEVR